jgi:putative membrane protein
MWNYGHMGWGSGSGGLLGIAPMALWWVFLIVAVVLLVKWLFNTGMGRPSADHGGAREILAERYARGEIDREEFDRKRRDLSL